MKVYTLRSGKGETVDVEAADEDDARRRVMVMIYGDVTDRVVPYAPNYRGTGLILISVAGVPTLRSIHETVT